MAIGLALILGSVGIVALVAATQQKKPPPGALPPPGGLPPLEGIPSERRKLPPRADVSEQPLPLELKRKMAQAMRALGVDDYGRIAAAPSKEAVQMATMVASELEQAGYPEAAKVLRGFAKTAAARIPSPPPEKQIPLPPSIPPFLQDKINRALQLERDPMQLRMILAALQALPDQRDPKIQAAMAMLENLIAQIEKVQAVNRATTEIDEVIVRSPGIVPTLIVEPPPPIYPAYIPPAPIPQPMPIPKSATEQAAESVAMHLKNLQAQYGGIVKTTKGKEDKTLVKRYQALAGLTTDGLTGPGTMLSIAKNGVSDLPLVMYWPYGSTATRVLRYRRDITAVANQLSDPARTELLFSATRERGQAGIAGSMPA